MNVIDAIAAPGSALEGGIKSGAGDDRYGFDQSVGVAWAIDGATDVGPIRLFPDAESDAAWFAEATSRAFAATPPGDAEAPADYMRRIVEQLAATSDREALVRLAQAPRASYPTAALVWLRARAGRLEGFAMGDALAIVRQPGGEISLIGDAGKQADESARARRVMAMTKDDRKKWLQDLRAIHNTLQGYWVFGVQPEAVEHALFGSAPCPPGTRALLVTDGFYRLVSPYGRMTDAELIARAGSDGLGVLMTELRALEASPGDDAAIGRFKTSDDATALLVEF